MVDCRSHVLSIQYTNKHTGAHNEHTQAHATYMLETVQQYRVGLKTHYFMFHDRAMLSQVSPIQVLYIALPCVTSLIVSTKYIFFKHQCILLYICHGLPIREVLKK